MYHQKVMMLHISTSLLTQLLQRQFPGPDRMDVQTSEPEFTSNLPNDLKILDIGLSSTYVGCVQVLIWSNSFEAIPVGSPIPEFNSAFIRYQNPEGPMERDLFVMTIAGKRYQGTVTDQFAKLALTFGKGFSVHVDEHMNATIQLPVTEERTGLPTPPEGAIR